MKKNTQSDAPKTARGPRTEQDERFLDLVLQAMRAEKVGSERAFSLELGRGPDFISRIRRGIQSAPADAWDTLLSRYAETRDTTSTNVAVHGSSQVVGTVHGDNHYSPTTLEACQLELEQHKRDLIASRGEVELLRQQIADRDRLIASQQDTINSKDEIISLLRGRV